MPRKKKERRTPGWMGRLTFLAIVLSIVFTLSYGTGAHIAVRFLNPALGAWWNTNEFAILECAAAALGMLIGIRIGARMVHDRALKNRAMVVSAIAAALGLPIFARLSAEVARFNFTSGASIGSWLIDRFTYDEGLFLDKLLTACVYSIKIAAFALPVGMILFGAAIALFMAPEGDPGTAGATSK
jgi:mannose/fructose/N-acetylgalactosamine-specific phosphotransferase system component IID